MHCHRFTPAPVTRRQMLRQCACGFGTLALAGQLSKLAAAGGSHFASRAQSVIFLYMDGGVSQVDSFDPKPALDRANGRPFPQRIELTQFDNVGTTMASPWKFSQHGEAGIWVSELFPNIARNADKLAVVRSMVSNF